MNTCRAFSAAVLTAVLAFGTSFAAGSPESWDGLVEIEAKRMDAVFVLPGADFRPYKKVMFDPTEVAFNKDWMKNVNETTAGVSRDISREDAEKIAATVRSDFGDIFNEAFRKAGYEITTTPGPDTLWLRPAVFNLYINAPDTMSAGGTRTYTVEAGEASLLLEVRDSTTQALLGRVVDRRATRSTSGVRVSNQATNVSDFRALFEQWVGICVQGFEELKSHSPVPTNLKPGQKL